ncbi:MAG TPA: FHA domain-containing protein [Verrucomicrobiae bacterium]|nr:FHA domain-containing protein [Verrucomicrobiae bacterium]
MFQFVVTDDGPENGQACVCGKFPFIIGRAPQADLRLLSPGVWDIHAEVQRDSETGKLAIQAKGEALLLINGARFERRLLVPGDQVQIGGASFAVTFSPATQSALAGHEGLVWGILVLVTGLQIFILWKLK